MKQKNQTTLFKISRNQIKRIKSEILPIKPLDILNLPDRLVQQNQPVFPSNSQRSRQAAVVTEANAKKPTLAKLQSIDIGKTTENLQSGNCKIIFFPARNKKEAFNEIGFKSFSEMMQTNTSWFGQASLMQNPHIDERKPIKTETVDQDELPKHQSFPEYLDKRLKFNKTQSEYFQSAMQQKWKFVMSQVTLNETKKDYETKRQPKVKLVQEQKNDLDETNEKEKEKVREDIDKKELELIEKDVQNTKLKNLKFFWYTIQIVDKWKPCIREGSTLVYFQNLQKCYLYGGVGNQLFNNMVTLNTRNWSWQDLGIGKGDVSAQGRFGHSCTAYKNNLIVHGGEKKYNSALKMRECYNDVRIYSPQEHSWSYLRTYGDVAEGRRNHCAVICGRFFMVLGGINSYGKYLNDIFALNIETLKWAQYDVEDYYQTGVAFATALSLFKSEIRIDNPYLNYELIKKKGKKLLKLSEEGIFIFGGRQSNGEATSDLRLIKLGSKPLISKLLEAKGIGPSPRYMHTMNYYEPLNVCVIYGGRDDSQKSQNISSIKNDIFILEMESLQWIQVAQIGLMQTVYYNSSQREQGKCSHSSVFIESKLFIFGGYTLDCFNNSEIQLVELDQYKIKQMLKESKTNQMAQRNRMGQLVLTTEDIQNEVALKVFTMDTVQSGSLALNDDSNNNHKLQSSYQQRQSLKNITSFQPINVQESPLIKEYRLKKEQVTLIQQRLNTSESKLFKGSRTTSRQSKVEGIHLRQISEGIKNTPDEIFEKSNNMSHFNSIIPIRISQFPEQIGENPIEEDQDQ